MTKKRYLPNKWKAFKDLPDEAFRDPNGELLSFDEFMDWKIAGYEIPDDIVCIIRAKNLETGKIKEYKYQYRHAAKKKCRKLLNSGDHELTVVQHDAVHFLYPAENDIF